MSVGVAFPDFPGCITVGDSVNEALQNAVEALEFHIEGMVDHGEEIPSASEADTTPPEWAQKPDMIALITVAIPSKAVRIQVTIDEGLLGRIDRAAKARGMSRSAMLAEGARRVIAG